MIKRLKDFLECSTSEKFLAPIKLLKALFWHNYPQKIISLLAAFMMWIFVMESQDPTIEGSYDVLVTISNAPYDYLASCEEKTITVKTLAPRSYFVKYDANAFRAYANLEGLGEGRHEITPQIIMPQGFEFINSDPAAVHVMIDSFAERQLPFELLTKGNVSSDTAIKNLSKSMEIVTVMGPKSLIDRVARIFGTLTFSNNTSGFEAQIPMKAVDANNNQIVGVRVVPSVVTVTVELESSVAKKIVPVVAEVNASDGWEVVNVNVDPAQIEITGTESAISSIVTIKTEPINIQTGQRAFKGKVRLDVPDTVTVKENEVNVSAEVVRRTIIRDTSTSETSTSDTN